MCSHMRSPIAKKVCLSVRPGNSLGSNVGCTSLRLSKLKVTQCYEMAHYLASMGCSLILHIHVMVN